MFDAVGDTPEWVTPYTKNKKTITAPMAAPIVRGMCGNLQGD
jgi:hypothetical protein